MAARKSCTHLTWSQAKANGGDSMGIGVKKKKGEKPKKLGQTEKIIAKQLGISKEQKHKDRSFVKQEKRLEDKLSLIAEKRAEERRQQLQIPKIKPHEQAQTKMSELAHHQAEIRTAPTKYFSLARSENNQGRDLSELQMICQCKEMQLSELMALEAIFADTDEYLVAESSELESLQKKLEAYQADEENESTLRSLVNHPPISILLQLTIPCEPQIMTEDGCELITSLLLRVTFPPTYPLVAESTESSPHFEVVYFMCADNLDEVNADKPIESMAFLDEVQLLESLQKECQLLLPDLAVYEVGVTWMFENLANFLSLNTRTTQGLLQAKRGEHSAG
eukprot:CAMPEP_0198295192 /NCGR_PEP_ID=MMETSP1449-20131203/26410_1 /TAXON_ID=420275 /ORGANISM="Attheya septentrionalis, Strain CCMP2084" /LENGTH=335 /DNA_ID=CAMNT_0043995409 /DNA_START=39 /DNA_END=1046 /DNA_ORIENTATION=+